ncbi:MAG: phage portal protein [Gammaproteobacteria bacterium]|nr:phage portal protein [Gammaproteobacteria bacterium]
MWARGAAGATVEGHQAASLFTPRVLSQCARLLCHNGNAVYYVDRDGEQTELIPVATWDITGTSPSESQWFYKLQLAAPDGDTERIAHSDSVLHFRYATNPMTPHQGLGPLQIAVATGKLAAGIEAQLANEAAQQSGYIIPTPDKERTTLADSIRGLEGKTKLVPSVFDFGNTRGASPNKDWGVIRLGLNPPASLVELRENLLVSILGLCGVPVELVKEGAGTAARESFRRFQVLTIDPVLSLMQQEASRKLASEVTFKADNLSSGDIASRARAFQSLVGGGMELERAVALSGLVVEE